MTTIDNLKCSVCGYVPDDEDIELTNYNILACSNCGMDNVCDICRFTSLTKPVRKEGKWGGRSKEVCSKCYPTFNEKTGEPFLPGKTRKSWLADEYFLGSLIVKKQTGGSHG